VVNGMSGNKDFSQFIIVVLEGAKQGVPGFELLCFYIFQFK
jgi:hypothetical protein